MKVTNTPGVNPSQVTDARAAKSGKAQDSNAAQARSGSQSSAQDSVTLTDAARQLASVTSNGGGSTPVNQKKVAALRAALAKGTYQVNPQRIANALISTEYKK